MKFSGHESFQCRLYWLKKGHDFVQSNGDFNSEDAPIHLGVGKNMVASIKYWMRAFGLFNDDTKKLSVLAKKIFDNDGWDPYLEDEGTLWLLHYQLVRNKYATAYDIIFNGLRKRKSEFNLDHFQTWVAQNGGSAVSTNSLKTDFSVFSRMYIPRDDSKDLDETYSGLLNELGLINRFKKENDLGKNVDWLAIEPSKRTELPISILLYCILENEEYGQSVSFDLIYNHIGSVFAMNRDGLIEKLEEIAENYKWITFSNEAGVKELQFSKKEKALTILNEYYEA